MAYRRFSGDPLLIEDVRRETPVAERPVGRLSPLEWTVVALAERDSLGSLSKPGRLALALGSVFGTRTESSLADPALEALRRAAVLTWHTAAAVSAGEIERFLEAGFSRAQYDAVLGHVLRAVGGRRTQS